MNPMSPAFLALLLGSTAGASTHLDIEFLVCKAAREQQAIEYRWHAYEYLKDDLKQKIDDGRVVGSELLTRKVHRTRPHGIAINQLVARDGKRLPEAEYQEELAKSNARMRQLAADSTELTRSLLDQAADNEDKASTMAGMDQAFELHYLGMDYIDGKPCHVVNFLPRDDFRPATREQSTFQKMRGVAWIDMERAVFLRLEADFIKNASVKYGPFATITAGSRLLLEQTEVEPGILMARSLELDLKLRIMFLFRKWEHRMTTYRELKRVNPIGRQLVP